MSKRFANQPAAMVAATQPEAATASAVMEAPITTDTTTADDEQTDDEPAEVEIAEIVNEAPSLNIVQIPANTLIPFTSLHFAAPKAPKTWPADKGGKLSRQVVVGVAYIAGTQLGMKFGVSLRWQEGSTKMEPSIQLPTFGGRFGGSAIDTDHAATSDSFEVFKAHTLAAAIVWLKERNARLKTSQNVAPQTIAPMAVDASDLGFDLSAAAPKPKAK